MYIDSKSKQMQPLLDENEENENNAHNVGTLCKDDVLKMIFVITQLG